MSLYQHDKIKLEVLLSVRQLKELKLGNWVLRIPFYVITHIIFIKAHPNIALFLSLYMILDHIIYYLKISILHRSWVCHAYGCSD